MPMVVTPWRGEIYYDGKIVFTIVISLLFIIGLKLKGIKIVAWKLGTIEWLLMGLTLLIVLSTVFSVDLRLSIWGQPHSREGLFVLITYIVIFYLFYRFFSFSSKVFELVLICGIVVSLYGILQYYNVMPSLSSITKGAWEDGLSTIGNRDFVGTYCTLLLPIAIGFYLYWHKKRGIVYSSILFVFMIISYTRSAWIAFLVYMAIFLFFAIKQIYGARRFDIFLRWMILAILFMVVFIAMNVISFSALTTASKSQQYQFIKRADTIVHDAKNLDKDSSGSYRVYYWKRAVAFMFDHILLGSGPDTFGIVFERHYGNINLYFQKAHNEYLQIAITLGYPALFIYMALVFIVLKRLWQGTKRSVFSQILFCCIVGYLVQAFFNISVICNAPIYWSLLGIGAMIKE